MLVAVPDLTVQLLEEGLTVLVVLFVGPNLLQISLGEAVEFVLDLDAQVVVALDGLAVYRDLLAGFLGGPGILDVLLALLRTFALLSVRLLLFLLADRSKLRSEPCPSELPRGEASAGPIGGCPRTTLQK